MNGSFIRLRLRLSLAGVLLCASVNVMAQQATPAADIEPTSPVAEQARQVPSTVPVRVRAATASDTLTLEATAVTGTRALPKVLYIVPWKKATLGELPSQPFNSVLDEVLMPLDRDVFRREVIYHETAQRVSGVTRR